MRSRPASLRLSRSSSSSLRMSCVWWMTSNSPPSCGYSFLIVLKQCGQVAMTLRTSNSFIVSMLARALSWNRYSWPMRRAGSPEHFSLRPMIAKSTPAVLRMVTTASVTFCARSSSDPAQPTKYRYSGLGLSLSVGTSARDLAHASRLLAAIPQGLDLFSRFVSVVLSSSGKELWFMTR